MTYKKFLMILFLTLILLNAAIIIAAPTITANPNPVLISFVADSGTTTIQWDAGPEHMKATVWRFDGKNETQWNANSVGSEIDTINYGQTYTYNLKTTVGQQVLASVTVTTKKEGFEVPPDLPMFFIGDIVSEPHGTFAKIRFTTKTDSLPVALVSLKKPIDFPAISTKDEKMWNNPDDVLRTTFAQPGTIHEATLVNLQPGRIHYYVLSAYDKQRKLWFKEKGAFITMQRQVTITFDKVEVIDDSDDNGGGELVFAFRINGELSPNGKNLTFEGFIDTGETKNINLQATILHPESPMKINVVGFDDDEGGLLHTCGWGGEALKGEREGSGETDCGEWTAKTRFYDTTILADGEDSNAPVTQSFNLRAYPVEDDSELKFIVSGRYTITYVLIPLGSN